MIGRLIVFIALATLPAGRAAAEWVATPVAAPDKVTEVRQDGDDVYAWAGNRWFLAAPCAEHIVCLEDGQPFERETDPDGIPDGLVATADGDGITSAWYTEPTDRYPHGALGDKVEGGAMVVQDVFGRRASVQLGPDDVFEDIAPRIADFDGDGRNEVLAIRSSKRAGAAMVIYDLAGGTLIEVASTQPVGRPNRWLNVAGIADFTGNGQLDVAAVITPHIGGTLEVVTLDRRRFRTVDSEPGFSNHIFGSTELGMSAVARINGDGIADLAVPDAKRRALRFMTVAGGSLREIAHVSLDAAITTAIGTMRSASPAFVFGLDDGRLVVVSNKTK